MARDRDAEFDSRGPLPADALAARLGRVVREADAVLARVTPDGLRQRREIQGYDVSVLQAIYHAVEHFAEHTGQIIWVTKHLTGESLDFYAYLADRDRSPGHQP